MAGLGIDLGSGGGNDSKGLLKHVNYPLMRFDGEQGWNWNRLAQELKSSKYDQFKQATARDEFFVRFLKSFSVRSIQPGGSPIKSKRVAVFSRLEDDMVEEKRKDLLKSISDMVSKSQKHQLKVKQNRKKCRIFMREVGSNTKRSRSFDNCRVPVSLKPSAQDDVAFQISLIPQANTLAGVTNAAIKAQKLAECFTLSNMTLPRLETLVHRLVLEKEHPNIENLRKSFTRSRSSEQYEDGGPVKQKRDPTTQVTYRDLLIRSKLKEKYLEHVQHSGDRLSRSKSSQPGKANHQSISINLPSTYNNRLVEVPWYTHPIRSKLFLSLSGLLHVISKYAIESEVYVLRKRGNSIVGRPSKEGNNSSGAYKGNNEPSKETSFRYLGATPNPNSVSISEVAEMNTSSPDATSKKGTISPRGPPPSSSRPVSMELPEDSLLDVLNLERVRMLVELSTKLKAELGNIGLVQNSPIVVNKSESSQIRLPQPTRKVSRSPTYTALRIRTEELSAVAEVDNSGEFQTKNFEMKQTIKVVNFSKFKRKSFSLTANTIPQELQGVAIQSSQQVMDGQSELIPDQDPERMINFLEDEFASKQKKSMVKKMLSNRSNQSISPGARKLTQSPLPSDKKGYIVPGVSEAEKSKMVSETKLSKIVMPSSQEIVHENSVEMSRELIPQEPPKRNPKASLYAQMKQQSHTNLKSVTLRPQIKIDLLCRKPSISNRLGFTVRNSTDHLKTAKEEALTRYILSPPSSAMNRQSIQSPEPIAPFGSVSHRSKLETPPKAVARTRIHWHQNDEFVSQSNKGVMMKQSLGLLTSTGSLGKTQPSASASNTRRRSYIVGVGAKLDQPYLQSQSKSRRELEHMFRIQRHRTTASSTQAV